MASASSPTALTVGMVLFPNVTQLDLTGPLQGVVRTRQRVQSERRIIAERAAGRLGVSR